MKTQLYSPSVTQSIMLLKNHQQLYHYHSTRNSLVILHFITASSQLGFRAVGLPEMGELHLGSMIVYVWK